MGDEQEFIEHVCDKISNITWEKRVKIWLVIRDERKFGECGIFGTVEQPVNSLLRKVFFGVSDALNRSSVHKAYSDDRYYTLSTPDGIKIRCADLQEFSLKHNHDIPDYVWYHSSVLDIPYSDPWKRMAIKLLSSERVKGFWQFTDKEIRTIKCSCSIEPTDYETETGSFLSMPEKTRVLLEPHMMITILNYFIRGDNKRKRVTLKDVPDKKIRAV